jgi:hypothetical protein
MKRCGITKEKPMKKLCAVLALLLVSCANPYAQFYRGLPDARHVPAYEPVPGDLQIYSTDNFEQDQLALMRRGYLPIGQAAFNAAANKVTEAQLREQARKVGAHVVLVASKYTHTMSGVVPLVMPQTTTSYSTGTATAYGPGGVVNVYGSGTTTTYGTQTMMMPYAVTHADFSALFLAKTRGRVGIIPQPVDDATRKRLETNAGIQVLVVAEDSPAFQADVLSGDVVLAVGGDTVQSVENYYQLLNKYAGQTVSFRLDRNGKTMEKQIEIRPYSKKAAP